MKTKFRAAPILAAGLLATLFASQAYAGCGDLRGPGSRAGAMEQLQLGMVKGDQPRPVRTGFIRVADREDGDAAIVGFWKFTFVARDNLPPGPADGTLIDAGYATWHSDGTELTNSSRPPASSSFCMGAWKQTGRSTFRLNHWALSWSNDGTAFVGPANIHQEVTVQRDGGSFEGTFSIDQYEATGTTIIGHVVGTVAATRITADQ